MKLRNAFIIAFVLFALAAAAYAASVPAVQKILPDKDSVKGWSVFPDSLQYAKGDDLTKIYNGGYELYTKNGVVDAARQMYKSGDDYAEVTVHTMKSAKAASDFLKYWQKENKVKALSKTQKSTYFLITKPSVSTYSITGKYFTIVTTFSSGDKAQKDVKAFMAEVEKRVPGK